MSTAASPNPLNEREHARVADLVAAKNEQIPELSDFMKELHALGMVDGWRNLDYVGPHRPELTGAVAVSDMVMETMGDVKERMKNGTR